MTSEKIAEKRRELDAAFREGRELSYKKANYVRWGYGIKRAVIIAGLALGFYSVSSWNTYHISYVWVIGGTIAAMVLIEARDKAMGFKLWKLERKVRKLQKETAGK